MGEGQCWSSPGQRTSSSRSCSSRTRSSSRRIVSTNLSPRAFAFWPAADAAARVLSLAVLSLLRMLQGVAVVEHGCGGGVSTESDADVGNTLHHELHATSVRTGTSLPWTINQGDHHSVRAYTYLRPSLPPSSSVSCRLSWSAENSPVRSMTVKASGLSPSGSSSCSLDIGTDSPANTKNTKMPHHNHCECTHQPTAKRSTTVRNARRGQCTLVEANLHNFASFRL